MIIDPHHQLALYVHVIDKETGKDEIPNSFLLKWNMVTKEAERMIDQVHYELIGAPVILKNHKTVYRFTKDSPKHLIELAQLESKYHHDVEVEVVN